MVKSTLACGLQECLSKEWMGDNFSDFRVVVDGSEYFCHKFILSACSTFFKTLLSSDFRENKEECVELKNMSKGTFDVIINAVYKGVDGLTLENVITVWQATHLLDIPFLIEECERFVSKNMSRNNFVEFYEIAKLWNAQNVILLALRFMKENFETFCATKTFLELSFPRFISLVVDDCLVVKTEDLVLESIIDWVSYTNNELNEIKDKVLEESCLQTSIVNTGSGDPIAGNEKNSVAKEERNEEKNTDIGVQHKSTCSSSLVVTEILDRKKYIVELLSTSRIFLASRSYLEKLLKHPLILSCVEAHELVYEALLYKWRSVSFPSNFVIPYRNCSGKQNVMAFVNNGKLHLYELKSQCTFKLDFDLKSNNLKQALNCCSDIELASIDSTLCFVYLRESAPCKMNTTHRCQSKNIAIIDANKKVSTIRTLCGSSNIHIGSSKDAFINITGSTFVPKTLDRVFSCIDFQCYLPIDSVCVFEDNILLFYHDINGAKVQCYNMYRPPKSSKPLTFNGPTVNIISIPKGRKMFLLQTNGALSSINRSIDDEDIQITLVIQLWINFSWKLTGAVYYKNELILFCKEKHKKHRNKFVEICDQHL